LSAQQEPGGPWGEEGRKKEIYCISSILLPTPEDGQNNFAKVLGWFAPASPGSADLAGRVCAADAGIPFCLPTKKYIYKNIYINIYKK